MPSVFELPEIIHLLTKYLYMDDLYNCVQVSRSLHTAFIPFLWDEFMLMPTADIQDNLSAIKTHAHHIRRLIFGVTLPTEYYTLQFVNLQRLEFARNDYIDNRYREEPTEQHFQDQIQIVQSNPTVETLVLNDVYPEPSRGFWNMIIKEWKVLYMLMIRRGSFHGLPLPTMEAFWEACARFKVLEFVDTSLPLTTIPVDFKFPHVKTLMMWFLPNEENIDQHTAACGSLNQLELAMKCPTLKALYWHTLKGMTAPVREFQQALLNETWPRLDTLHLSGSSKMTDEYEEPLLTSVVYLLPTLKEWKILQCRIEPLSLSRVLDRHFTTIETLHLALAVGMTGAMVHEVMARCPGLKRFEARYILAEDICHPSSRPWVCDRLEHLSVFIAKPEGSPEGCDRMIFERLSRLSRLSQLSLGGIFRLERPEAEILGRAAQGWSVDLTLNSGLGLLSSFTRLQRFEFKGTQQPNVRVKEVEWMVEHWKRRPLTVVGMFSKNEEQQNEMSKFLRDRGIICIC
ncbi:hypothetical protein BG011_003901 [Mortierella polycephala]|uniref:F-box domain-containing protein n=1 Tax=Mortierella polycephala TaxID=41804 RepID=A0A9P6U2D1_9FUNG|nr:hypothetical protein BG011_003901 [Mortierella polycephala]